MEHHFWWKLDICYLTLFQSNAILNICKITLQSWVLLFKQHIVCDEQNKRSTQDFSLFKLIVLTPTETQSQIYCSKML